MSAIGLLPYGGKEIAELRAIGKRPADMVLVSLIGPLREENPVLIAKPGRTYDWRFLVGLDVLLVAKTTQPADMVRKISDEMQGSSTNWLGIWFADCQDGLSLSWSCPFGSYRPKASAVRRLSVWGRREFAGIGTDDKAAALAAVASSVKGRAMKNLPGVEQSVAVAAMAGFAQLFGDAWRTA